MQSRRSIDKHPALVVHSERPFNAEPPLAFLRQSLITPVDLFYVRNHGDVPTIDPGAYRLSVAGMVEKRLDLSLHELRECFPSVTVEATLSCAGNRRAQLMEHAPIPGELAWREAAIGNAHWTGAALGDVLAAAGFAADAEHVAFEGVDEADEGGETVRFGASIPLDKALRPETILAYEMNGELLPKVHGFPLRVVVPGYIGARSVKWLSAVTIQATPSSNHFQARAYKLFPPDVRAESIDWSQGVTLGEVAVNSAICKPVEGETLSPGHVVVEGWALAGAERRVERVEISADGGGTWATAELMRADGAWAWCFWETSLELEPGSFELVVRAWDSSAVPQPQDPGETWNLKGYANNAWHRVRVRVEERAASAR
jgi:sulfite oxidase